jgi:hypothetical protein
VALDKVQNTLKRQAKNREEEEGVEVVEVEEEGAFVDIYIDVEKLAAGGSFCWRQGGQRRGWGEQSN